MKYPIKKLVVDDKELVLQDGILEVNISRIIYWMGKEPSEEEFNPRISATIWADRGFSSELIDQSKVQSFYLEAESIGSVSGKLCFNFEDSNIHSPKSVKGSSNRWFYELGYISVVEHDILYTNMRKIQLIDRGEYNEKI